MLDVARELQYAYGTIAMAVWKVRRIDHTFGVRVGMAEDTMKQESRFVAELYRYLAPFIDTAKPLYISLDGIAARVGVSGNVFTDPDVPDLWFTLVGDPGLTLLEAKVLNADRSVTVNQAQLTAWRSTGLGQHRPIAWVAADEALTAFFYWSHADFLARLDASNTTVSYPKLRMPDSRIEFPEVRQLALHVLRFAQPQAQQPSSPGAGPAAEL